MKLLVLLITLAGSPLPPPGTAPVDCHTADERVTHITCWLADQYRAGMPPQLYVELFTIRTRAARAVTRWATAPTDARACEALQALWELEQAIGGGGGVE